MTVTWDVSNCASANYHIIYGKGENVATLATNTPTVDGGQCAIGATGTYGWTGVPDPSAYTSKYLWYLVVGDNGGTTEGSWGLTSAARGGRRNGCQRRVHHGHEGHQRFLRHA